MIGLYQETLDRVEIKLDEARGLIKTNPGLARIIIREARKELDVVQAWIRAGRRMRLDAKRKNYKA